MTHEQFIQIRFLKTTEKLSSVQIAEKLGMKERTVRDWWNLPQFPVKEREKWSLCSKPTPPVSPNFYMIVHI